MTETMQTFDYLYKLFLKLIYILPRLVTRVRPDIRLDIKINRLDPVIRICLLDF